MKPLNDYERFSFSSNFSLATSLLNCSITATQQQQQQQQQQLSSSSSSQIEKHVQANRVVFCKND
jgi:hypothetical protein